MGILDFALACTLGALPFAFEQIHFIISCRPHTIKMPRANVRLGDRNPTPHLRGLWKATLSLDPYFI